MSVRDEAADNGRMTVPILIRAFLQLSVKECMIQHKLFKSNTRIEFRNSTSNAELKKCEAVTCSQHSPIKTRRVKLRTK
jgi:hypothetical protein